MEDGPTARRQVTGVEATGVALVTCAGAFAVYALVFSLGPGSPMSPVGACVAQVSARQG